MSFSKNNLPTAGQLIEIDIVWISRCCGSTLVCFFYSSDESYIYFSDAPSAGRVEKLAWSSVVDIRSSSAVNAICIDP